MIKMSTEIKLLNEKAVIPKRAHETDSGYDLTFIGFDKIIGDSDKSVQEKASILTPVPGGVGPLTIFNLFKNLIDNK